VDPENILNNYVKLRMPIYNLMSDTFLEILKECTKFAFKVFNIYVNKI